MGVEDEALHAVREKRCRGLMALLGIGEEEAGDTTIKGRLVIIAKLKAAKRAEIARGHKGSWLYDVNRHLSICAVLRKEYEGLEEILDGRAAPAREIRCGNVVELRP